jgi:hypothetical protein
MTTEEFQIAFINNLEVLSKQLEKLTAELKRNNDVISSSITVNKDLKETVGHTNKTFEQVSGYLKDIYAKIQGLELIQKLVSGMGGLGGGLGGFGQKPGK